MGEVQDDGKPSPLDTMSSDAKLDVPQQRSNGASRSSSPASQNPTAASRDELPDDGALESRQPSVSDDGNVEEMPDAPRGVSTRRGAEGELSAPPMTTSTSASSNAESNNAPGNSAAPYGTRSRNRPRGERVNYAEDSGDMEFEMQHANGVAGQARAVERDSTSSPGTSARQSPGPTSRKGAAAPGTASTAQSRDPSVPGTSGSTVQSAGSLQAAPVSRKRKAAVAAAAATVNGHAATNGVGSAGSRRAANNAQSHPHRESNLFTFERSKQRLKNERLEADDGTAFAVDDFVYLVCEPPGEPYYLGRIMEFRHSDSSDPSSAVDSMRINWFYRPRDVMRSSQDTRLLYATMHSDMCPLISLRGRIQITHRDDIDDLDEYRKQKDSFWFDEVFDRFIHRYYKAVPVRKVVNVPDKVKQALNERWKYIVVEQNKVKEMIQEGKNCKRCQTFAAPDDSVECAVCKNMYHMQCVRPPLLKKPSRGFGWSCAPCSRAHERNLEARHTPIVGDGTEAEDEEMVEEEELDSGIAANTTAPSPSPTQNEEDLHPGTQAEIRLAKMWPMRYLGIHCRPEDALLLDDQAIYPRASSRLGPRHQANINDWYGRPVELVKPAEVRKRFAKNTTTKNQGKFAKDTGPAVEAEKEARAKRPKWVQDEPLGYVARGDDHPNRSKENTAKLMFKLPTFGEHSSRGEDNAPSSKPEEQVVDDYMRRAMAAARVKDIKEYSVDFLDAAVRLFQDNNYDADAALRGVRNLDPKRDLRDPLRILTGEEKKRFDEGAAKFGSELRNIRLHVKTVKHGDIVRYWYIWKKTDRGREIWASYGGRRGAVRKAEVDSHGKVLEDVADDQDDSAFDLDKAAARKRGFCCKFCNTKKARQWRRAPGVAPGSTVSADGKPNTKDKVNGLFVALCDRCASFWRRYAIKWEEYEDVAKKIAQGGTKQMRRRIDEEVLQEFRNATEGAASADIGDAGYGTPTGGAEPAKKKQRTDGAATAQIHGKKAALPPKAPTPPPPPIVPAQPRFRYLPCAVCRTETQPMDPAVVVCSSCKLTVHRNCYGVAEAKGSKWTCDTCTNDRKETVSYDYQCVLCPVEHRAWTLVETPRSSSKKKGEREKEKEKLEKDLVDAMEREYKQEQKAKGRPLEPREALKRTAANNWVHLTCAVWTPETKFGDTKGLDLVEGIPQIPKVRYEQSCKLCKFTDGPCVSCHHCHATFHVGCAQNAGYALGFDIIPVKGSRRESTNIVTFANETGVATAAIWCKEHIPKTILHYPNEIVDEQLGTYALQRFVLNFKQADLTLTGTTRKANLLDESAKSLTVHGAVLSANRRSSTTTTITASAGRGRPPSTTGADRSHSTGFEVESIRRCNRCGITTSPRWFPMKDKVDQHRTGAILDGNPISNGIKSEPGSVDAEMINGILERGIGAPPDRYYCQKCHWKKVNNVEEPKPERNDRERTRTRSPTGPTPAPQSRWYREELPRAHPVQNLWPPQPASVAVPPQQSGPHVPQPHAPYQHTPIPPQHQPMAPRMMPMPGSVPGSALPSYRPAAGNPAPNIPPPLHLAQSAHVNQLPNGLPSPSHHVLAQHSPTHPPLPPGAPHQNGSPFNGASQPSHRPSFPGPPGPPPHGVSQGSPPPPPSYRQPTTPREVPPGGPLGREPSAPPAGASASPSLRNLLH